MDHLMQCFTTNDLVAIPQSDLSVTIIVSIYCQDDDSVLECHLR